MTFHRIFFFFLLDFELKVDLEFEIIVAIVIWTAFGKGFIDILDQFARLQGGHRGAAINGYYLNYDYLLICYIMLTSCP